MKKKLFSILLVVALCMAMTVPALAAGSGKITVSGTTSGMKYDIYKIMDLSYVSGKYTYTIDSDFEAFFKTSPGSGYIVDTNSGSLNQIIVNGGRKYINITSANIAQFTADAMNYATKTSNPKIAYDAQKTATGSSVTFSGLDLGYYLLFPEGAAEITGSYASVASIDSTDTEAEVAVKADTPSITKTIDDQSVDVGQTVTYTITGKVPTTTGYTAYIWQVSDTMDAGLTFDSTATINVTINNTKQTLSKVTDTPDADLEYKVSNNGFVFYMDATKHQADAGKNVVITYSPVVNSGAVITQTKNQAVLTYSNNPYDVTKTATTPPVDKEVWSNKIVIDKYDAADGTKANKLEGAEFVLYKLVGSERKYYKYDSTTDSVSWVSLGTAAANVTALAVKSAADAGTITKAVTNGSGAATFVGVEDGTYMLQEILAPVGYNMPIDGGTEDASVSVAGTGTTYKVGVTGTAQIGNSAGTILPSTGGMGTTLFYVIGATLALAGATVLLKKRRKTDLA